jgi:hypothetical protein
MNTFRFVLHTWMCAVILYPVSVMCGDILIRSNTQWELFGPLLALAVTGGLPGLLFGTLILSRLRSTRLTPAMQYAIWCGSGLLVVTLLLLGPLHKMLAGELARFALPMIGDLVLVLALRCFCFTALPHTKIKNNYQYE